MLHQTSLMDIDIVCAARSFKAKKPPCFRQPEFFRKIMTILERHHYRLPVRRFVIDLFEKSVMRSLVLDDEDDNDDDERDEEVGAENG